MVMDEVRAVFSGTSLVGEVAFANSHAAANDANHHEAHEYAIAVQFVHSVNWHHHMY